ncbi:ChaN family lipoprotein [Thermaurantiacus sp.]
MFASPAPATAGLCLPAGQWVDRAGAPMSPAAFLDQAMRAGVLLLGEAHGNPAHHRWQADVVAGLLARGRKVVLGLEQLPRSAQSVLDSWVQGSLSAEQFRAASRWDTLWGHDFAAYLPLLALARDRRLPMVALNVEREFVRAVGREGFAQAASKGAPVSRPAPPASAYVEHLQRVFLAHGRAPDAAALGRFVEAQTVWDRAFAEALLAARRRYPDAIVVGIMGSGHVEQGWGAEHQLRALGETAVVSAIPVPATPPCPLAPGAADALAGAG